MGRGKGDSNQSSYNFKSMDTQPKPYKKRHNKVTLSKFTYIDVDISKRLPYTNKT